MELLDSLNNLLPKYETTLPFSKDKVTFTPFRVKDAKNISIILQEENKTTALKCMIDLLKTNTSGTNVLELCLADAEFLFLQIRSKSVDERLNLLHNKEKIQVFISQILPRNEIKTETIQISTDLNLTLETPKVKDILKLNSYDKDDFIKSCIKKITVRGEIYHTNKYLTEDLHKLIDDLPLSVIPKLEDFLKNQPELYIMLPTKDGDKEVSGFLRFFTYR
jgi:hypothetical protein